MQRGKRFTYILGFLALAGLGFAQTTSHYVGVTNEEILGLLSGSGLTFNFAEEGDNLWVRVGDDYYPKARLVSYREFINSGQSSRLFAGTGHTTVGIGVISNRPDWTVSVTPIGNLDAPLDNSRLHVYVVKLYGGGQPLMQAPTPLPSTGSLPLIQATTDGVGSSNYSIYYLLEMRSSDVLSDGAYSDSIQLEYTVAAP